ncbi:MAG: class I poly(R)-hydroxyalkanoic acid synthase [Burkholderiales bacterium]|nr:class I poly(R)-hydroxyalkanoic acid synthase [Burkholderiales bacterium]
MARSTPSKTAARTAARPARRAPRARAAAAPADKAVEADIARAAERAPAAHPGHPHGPEAFGAAIGGFLNSLGGLQVPRTTLSQLQEQYVDQARSLWNGAVDRMPLFGAQDKPAEPAAIGDRRFAAEDWTKNPTAAFTAQMYLLNARTLTQLADSLQGDEKTKARVRFAVQQFVDAASPANYLALNPEAQRKAIETQGESLTHGLQHLWDDVQQGHLSQTDESVFEVGRNVATTEGAVVFENDYLQLIEYKPLTPQVHARPMLFVPPCINKYYILDLQPANSLIRHTVAEGHRTFVISWRNPDESMQDRTWDDYIENAVIRSIEVVQQIAGAKTINTLGFCVGGTLLATALGVLAARGRHPAESLTLLTTFLDFSNTGVLDIFVDEASVQLREMTIGAEAPGGPKLLKGGELASTFSFLRPNDLVWNYVVGNYLKGDKPPAFDLLYWNSDATNMPGPMYCWYLRNTYLENALREPGALTVCGEKLDLSQIKAPAFIYGSREDHIVPWKGAWESTRILGGRTRFVLGASGHIAGVINPPKAGKRSHWTNDKPAVSADAWFAGATEHPGSWWTGWSQWLAGFGGGEVAAPRAAGGHGFKAIEPAPGRYVQQKA